MTSQKPRFGYHFAKLHRLMAAMCKQDLKDLGMQPSQIPFIVELLHCDGPVTQDELSAVLAIDKAATARAMEQLERNGFVHRMVNPHNRRQKLVSVTAKARGVESALFDILQATSDVFTRNFPQKDIDLTLKLLNRMIANAMDTDS